MKNFKQFMTENKKIFGYKVMNYDPEKGTVISGADNRVTKDMKLRKGMVMKMPGKGIFMSTNKEYVKQYYGGMHDHEAVIKFEFDSSKISSGNITDKESEITVPEAKVVDFEIQNNLDEGAT
jgi:hypothetical protein